LSAAERNVLDRLLDANLPAHQTLRQQAAHAKVGAEAKGDTRTIRFVFCAHVPRAEIKARVPVEAQAVDADGGEIAVLLHVIDGRLDELEVYRFDGGDIHDEVDPNSMRVMINPD
jgi:hypothetical protein